MTTATEYVERRAAEAAAACPGCGSGQLQPFYEVHGVPSGSTALAASEAEARGYPRGEIVLAYCARCGFITNTAFDPARVDYTGCYEDQQGFSPAFQQFAGRLARRLVSDYRLYGRDIVEVGCGKGDFLSLLCAMGANRGVGIDPAASRDRLPREGAGRVTLVQERFEERHGQFRADLLCCRHTLEHIHWPREFLASIRRAIGDAQTIVFFEVPDTGRILGERAFWDVYYEHCSYFTAGSLGRLFRSTGFEILDLYRDFGDQYLLIEARAARETSGPHPAEEGPEDLAADVRGWAETMPGEIERWRGLLAPAPGRRTAVWGSGSKCVAFLSALAAGDEIGCVVDINPHRQGQFLPGSARQVVAPSYLTAYRPDLVIVMNPMYREEIGRMLQELGLQAELAVAG